MYNFRKPDVLKGNMWEQCIARINEGKGNRDAVMMIFKMGGRYEYEEVSCI